MSEREPPHRTQKRPLPDPQPVLQTARQNRLSWLEAMAKVSHNPHSEQDRIEAQEEVDTAPEKEYK